MQTKPFNNDLIEQLSSFNEVTNSKWIHLILLSSLTTQWDYASTIFMNKFTCYCLFHDLFDLKIRQKCYFKKDVFTHIRHGQG